MPAKHFFLSSAVAATFWLGTASAATLPSLDRATFQAALAGSSSLGSQDFDSIAAGTAINTVGGVTYSSATGQPVVTNAYLTSTNPNGLGLAGRNFFLTSDTATFTFATAITAFAIDINTFATAPASYLAALSNGDTSNSIFETFPGTGTGQFLGFVSDNPFTSVTVSSVGGFSYTLDTLIYGAKSDVTGAVPEPATWAMMIFGFAAVGFTMRRRRYVERDQAA